MERKLRTASLCIHAGYKPKNGEPIELPIIQSTTFKYDDSDEMAQLFDLKKEGYFYTRLQNPTNDAVAAKIAALEGGVGCVLTSSGQAANFYAIWKPARKRYRRLSARTRKRYSERQSPIRDVPFWTLRSLHVSLIKTGCH